MTSRKKRRTSSSTNSNLNKYEPLEPRRVLAAPVAIDDALHASTNVATEIELVIANDTDADGDTLTILSTGTPQNGTISVIDGEFHYKSNTGFFGNDSFTYSVSDPQEIRTRVLSRSR